MLKDLLNDWDIGLLLADGCSRLAPLRVLECHPDIRVNWKATLSGVAAPTNVSIMKNVIYALHRRVKGLGKDTSGAFLPAVSLDVAIRQLQDDAVRSNGNKQITLLTLAEKFIPKLHKRGEAKPAAYERDVLDKEGGLMFGQMSAQW